MVFIPEDGSFRFRRSVLFMPASNERALGKAAAISCDSVIFDLEDAVSENERPDALANLRKFVKDADFGGKETIIRTGETRSRNFSADLKIAVECGVSAILLPKVETAEMVANVQKSLVSKGSDARLWAMIETPLALMNLREITTAGSAEEAGRLQCLVVGPNDLAKSTGVNLSNGRAAMHPWMMQIVAAARACRMSVLDGVFNNFRDREGLSRECAEGALMGFDGKTLIHPSQIEAANHAFGPSDTELERARQIVDAFARKENAGKGAIQLDGEMIERLHLDMAKRLLDVADAV